MHTGQPSAIRWPNGCTYQWLLHWSEKELPEDQHFVIENPQDKNRKLNMAVTLLFQDVKKGILQYCEMLSKDLDLQTKFRRAETQMENEAKLP